MPGHHDHHRPSNITINPYDTPSNRIGDYTAQEIATLQSRLDKQLGPEYISSRPGNGGGKVYYIAAEKVINIANEVFGFNGWSSQVQTVQVDFCDENEQTGKISLGLSIIMRVTLRGGAFHEDIGYGHIENCKGKAAAFEKAKKEAATDALKRSLRNFGNVLGNCLYDKEYLAKVTKVKVPPSKWDAENLYRHPDFVKREPIADMDHDMKSSHPRKEDAASIAGIEVEDEFGGNLFDETELNDARPDEVVLPVDTRRHGSVDRGQSNQANQPLQASRTAAQQSDRSGQPIRRSVSNPMPPPQQHHPSRPIIQPREDQRRPLNPQANHVATEVQPIRAPPLPPPIQPHVSVPQIPLQARSSEMLPPPPHSIAQTTRQYSTPPTEPPIGALVTEPSPHTPLNAEPQQPQQPQQPTVTNPPVGFITSRCAELLNKPDTPQAATLAAQARFNPNAESPSIRKTIGINHSTSAPINRSLIGGPSNPSNGAGPPIITRPPTNFVNPAENVGRRVGMPGGGLASPHQPGRGTTYKPPSVIGGKRLYPEFAGNNTGSTVPRPPLTDVSNTHQSGTGSVNTAKAAIQEADAELLKRQRIGEA